MPSLAAPTDPAWTARALARPDETIWVVVGDRAQIEPKIRELGFKEVIVIDADGNVVK